VFLKASLCVSLRWSIWCRKGKDYVVGAGNYNHDRFEQE